MHKTALSNTKYCKMKYIPGFFENPRNILFRINLISTTSGKLKDLLCDKIDPIPKEDVSVVYMILPRIRKDTYLEYIGMTSH